MDVIKGCEPEFTTLLPEEISLLVKYDMYTCKRTNNPVTQIHVCTYA